MLYRRGSRLSVMISQNDLRRLSTVSAAGGRSGATTPKFGASATNPALASLVSSQQQENRETEVTRKLNRLALPSSSNQVLSPGGKPTDRGQLLNTQPSKPKVVVG